MDIMNDIDGMTVAQHHKLCLGVLALCYRYVPPDLQRAIMEGLESAERMGAGIKAENAKHGLPLALLQ